MTDVSTTRRRPPARVQGVRPTRARRVTPRSYRLLLVTHLTVSVGWLGVVYGKVVLGIAIVTAGTPAVAERLYAATTMLDLGYPPVAVATIVTGVALSLGTRWGLLRHWWVTMKIVLTGAVISTAVALGDRVVAQSLAAPAAVGAGPATSVLSLSVAHLLMLVVATVLSVYKPWGRVAPKRAG